MKSRFILALVRKPLALILLATALISSIPTYAVGVVCEDIFKNLAPRSVEKVDVPEAHFSHMTRTLRATLSGKLATVFRAEWKTKLKMHESNSYVLELVKTFLTPQTQSQVLEGLNVQSEGFTRSVQERLSKLQAANKLQLHDELFVRDPAPPVGATDTTFTYYTNPILDAQGNGKHQPRIRGYLRKIDFKSIELNQDVQGFNEIGAAITITRVSNNMYKVMTQKSGSPETLQHLSFEELQKSFGSPAYLFAPHGKSFKLEIKTALEDVISGEKYINLAGEHMVQKLDIGLSLKQVIELFAPLSGITEAQKKSESLQRIEILKSNIITKQPESKARAEAVLEVMAAGVNENPDFLTIEGATIYHRSAFESKSGFQTTIDREQGVYDGNMYTNNALKNPIQAVKLNTPIRTGFEDARHVEFKLPVYAVAAIAGLKYRDPSLAPPPSQNPLDKQTLERALQIYYPFVISPDHSGKFNYIRSHHSLIDMAPE